MAYQNNNGYGSDPVQRAPSPYYNNGDNGNSNPATPYTPYQQGSSNSYYDQHPQGGAPNIAPTGDQQYHGYPPTEGERGLIGAIGGGLTGGYVGKQTCHTFLGTVGGAIVGSLTEDWAKKKKPLCGSRPHTPVCEPPPQHCPPPAQQPCLQPQYSPPYVDTHTTVATATHVHPGYNWQSPPPQYTHPYPPPKPCGHTHQCGCSFFGKH